VELQLHIFLTLAIDGGEWLSTRSGIFAFESSTISLWIGGWVGFRCSVDVLEKRKITSLYRNYNSGMLGL
jgi:hypothetical protein